MLSSTSCALASFHGERTQDLKVKRRSKVLRYTRTGRSVEVSHSIKLCTLVFNDGLVIKVSCRHYSGKSGFVKLRRGTDYLILECGVRS